ncbi:MAG: NAD(P)H-dependent oxidoreductase [Planctomycetota bacterium]
MNERQKELCSTNTTDFSDLKAVLVNTTLKRTPDGSHTRLLLDVVADIMGANGVDVSHVHLASRDVPGGVYPDMTEYGYDRDEWPEIFAQVLAADILVVGSPIWLGEESSICRVLIERLYAMSGELNDRGQSIYYGKVGGCVVTGNEDGIKHVAMTVGYALSHLGFVIPPQADCGWIGEAGPGPSYGDELENGSRAGFDNDFTQRNMTIMTWNLMHLARMLRDAGGIPNHGNDRRAWKAGCRFDFANPEHRA